MIIRSHKRRGGFTILELVIAMGVLSLLFGGIFQIAKASMTHSNLIVQRRQFETEKAALISMLQNHFEQLPGNAIMDLRWNDVGSHFLSTMTFQDAPMNFNWGGRINSAEAFQIVTEKRGDGFLDIVLKFYDEEILDPASRNFLDVEPSAEVVLMEDVNRFEWQVLNGQTQELQNEWDVRGRQPLKVILNAILEPKGDTVLHTFWITPKANPQTYIRSILRNGGGGGGGGGGAAGGGVGIGGGGQPPVQQ